MKKISSSLQFKIMVCTIFLIILSSFPIGIASYIKSVKIVESKFAFSHLHTVKQIASSLELITNDIREASLYFIQSGDLRQLLKSNLETNLQELEKARVHVNDFLTYLVGEKPYIHSIYIMGKNNTIFDTYGIKDQTLNLSNINVQSFEWFPNVITSRSGILTYVISLVRPIRDINNFKNLIGYLEINIDEKSLFEQVISLSSNFSENFVICNQNYFILSSTEKTLIGKNLAKMISTKPMENFEQGFFYTKLSGKTFLITYSTIKPLGWKVVSFVEKDRLVAENRAIQSYLFITILLALFAAFIFLVFFQNTILYPLKQLRILIDHISNQNFDVYMQPRGNDEVSKLIQAFNSMSAKLNELMNQVYIATIKQKEAELKALQERINPHFLYNTLDTIYWTARLEGAKNACILVEALSKLFRSILANKSNIITVKEEIEHLSSYILIQKVRYQDLIEFSLNVQSQALCYKTVKLVLQPIVENAIYHGIEKSGKKGKISIEVFTKDEKLYFIVSDTGAGAPKEVFESALKNDSPNGKIGLKNVNDRIKLAFGNEYGMEIESTPGLGTKVTVVQPALKEGDLR